MARATKEKPVVELEQDGRWNELRTAATSLHATRGSLALLEQQDSDLKDRIKEMLREFEIDEATLFQMPGISVTLTPTKGRKSLNKDMLIDAGCLPSQIEKGYKQGEGYTSVSVHVG